jgi:FkbH-like protein
MNDSFNLGWLLPRPTDFNARLAAAVEDASAPLGPRLRELANHALESNGLNRLAKVLAKARREGRPLQPLAPLRVGLLSNSTMTLIASAIEGSGLRHGLAIETVEAPFGRVVQEALDPSSVIASGDLDVVLVALDIFGLALGPTPGDSQAAQAAVDAALAQVAAIRSGLKANSRATIVWQTVARLPETSFGSLDFRLPGTARWLAERFNRGLAENMPGDELLLDAAGIAETVGLERWHDPVMRNIGKLPFSQAWVPLYAEHFARLLGAMRGRSRKVLVLDLDNTLWGGIVGDDGIEGIVIGQGNAQGEAHLAVQRGALDMHGRGVVLAVSSKNEDSTARLPFQKHPDMLLREEHFAVFQANWSDKAANLATIADSLNLGRDALVFLDDNPAERMQVRAAHPEIAVPELPADSAYYWRVLAAAGYFEAVAFSEDDRKRTGFYKENAKRLELQGSAGSLDDYHRSLDMTASFAPFNAVGRARIAQLINKSNQFNLTTRRYTEDQVARLEEDKGAFTLQVRLADIFGDNGMVSVIIAHRAADEWHIDTWLMSCRVLGRRLEEAVLAELVRAARADGARALVGRFVPTDRNMMVARHYEKLGFAKAGEDPNGESEWRLDLDAYTEPELPMAIERSA